jgi:hypothetical protein
MGKELLVRWFVREHGMERKMNFEELNLYDRVTLYVLPALLSAPDVRRNLSNKTLIHEARQIAEAFVATVEIDTDTQQRTY